MTEAFQKTQTALKEVTNNKIEASFNILGKVQTNIFCWNPAKVGGKFRGINTGNEFYVGMPGSDFSSTGIGLEGNELVESYCNNCIFDGDIYKMDCKDILSYSNLWNSDKVSRLNTQISDKLGFKFEDYDGIFIIFGKLGQVLAKESDINLEYLCRGSYPLIGGYSTLIMAENSIKAGGFINCSKFNTNSYYERMGWHKLLHEILHRLGAKDVYATGTTFGIITDRTLALEIDSRIDESIMGNDDRECMKRSGSCTQVELERAYLDKYNKNIIGIYDSSKSILTCQKQTQQKTSYTKTACNPKDCGKDKYLRCESSKILGKKYYREVCQRTKSYNTGCAQKPVCKTGYTETKRSSC